MPRHTKRTVTVTWVVDGTVKTYPKLDQRQVNRLVTHLSDLQDTHPAGRILITVK